MITISSHEFIFEIPWWKLGPIRARNGSLGSDAHNLFEISERANGLIGAYCSRWCHYLTKNMRASSIHKFLACRISPRNQILKNWTSALLRASTSTKPSVFYCGLIRSTVFTLSYGRSRRGVLIITDLGRGTCRSHCGSSWGWSVGNNTRD
jgi:hypothetical protein